MKTKTKKHVVRVTRADIKKGDRGEASSCAVALALRRRFKGDAWDVDGATLDCSDQHLKVRTPKGVAKWIERFDAGRNVRPFKFNLRFA